MPKHLEEYYLLNSYLLLKYMITPIIAIAAIPRSTNGRIGVLSPVDTAFVEELLFDSSESVAVSEAELSLLSAVSC